MNTALLSPLGYDLRANIEFDAMLDFDVHGSGLTLANDEGIFFIILQDASTPGCWRYQAFNCDGMLEHCTQLTPRAAITAAVQGRGACHIVSRNTLDSVAVKWLALESERRKSSEHR